METTMIYLAKASIGIMLFYLAYYFFLRNQGNLRANRLFLLSSVLMSFVLPLVKINFYFQASETVNQIVLDGITVAAQQAETIAERGIDLWQIAIAAYLAGVSVLLLRFIVRIGQIMTLILTYGIERHRDSSFVFIKKEVAPFSFFGIIFISENALSNEHVDKIIAHEKAHIQMRHSLDVMLMELLSIALWVNPFVWMYRRSIQHIHEYQADRQVIEHGTDSTQYQKILFSLATGIPYNSVVNSFNQSLLKKRLIMMKKEKPTKSSNLRLMVTLPVVCFLLFAFTNFKGQAFTIVNQVVPAELGDTVKKKQNDVFKMVEQMPVFKNGGEQGLRTYIAQNVKYPKSAIKEGIQGKVYVKFIIDQQGRVTNVKELRTTAQKPNKENAMVSCSAPALTQEALRVVSGIPDFIPGKQKGKTVKVEYTVPINFVLD